ncbi:MAG TPA: hypothetical protein VI756_25830 [Blastocatellia bacterium]
MSMIRPDIIKRPSQAGQWRPHVDPAWRREYRRQQEQQQQAPPPPQPNVDWHAFFEGLGHGVGIGLCYAAGVALGAAFIGVSILTAGSWKPARRR